MGHLPVRRTSQPGRLPGMRPPQPPATSLSSELYCCIYRARSHCHRHHHDAKQRRPPARVHPPTSNSESALHHAVKIRRHQCMDEAPLHLRNRPLVPRSKARHQVEGRSHHATSSPATKSCSQPPPSRRSTTPGCRRRPDQGNKSFRHSSRRRGRERIHPEAFRKGIGDKLIYGEY